MCCQTSGPAGRRVVRGAPITDLAIGLFVGAALVLFGLTANPWTGLALPVLAGAGDAASVVSRSNAPLGRVTVDGPNHRLA